MTDPDRSSHHDASHDLKTLLQEAEQALASTAGDASDKFAELRGRLRSAVETGRHTFDRFRSEATRRVKQADELVHEKPYHAMGLAVGVGAIIGILLARRSDSSR